MTTTLIIFGIFILAAFTGGFYFGYLKREKEPPFTPITTMTEGIKELTQKKEEIRPTSFYD